MSEIKDSGNRTEFEVNGVRTGAVRDIQEDKGRVDLVPLGSVASLFVQDVGSILINISYFMETGNIVHLRRSICDFCMINGWSLPNCILEVSMHYKQGAEKYGERNWEKGIPLHSYIDSGVRHFLKHIDGQTDERHDRAFVWNMLGAIWTMEHKPEMIDIPFEIIGGKNLEK